MDDNKSTYEAWKTLSRRCILPHFNIYCYRRIPTLELSNSYYEVTFNFYNVSFYKLQL